jgi:hypothetical protein
MRMTYMYLRTNACTQVCTHICMHVCMYLRMYKCIIYVHMCMYVHEYTNTYMHLHTQVCLHTGYVRMSVWTMYVYKST